MPFHRQYGSATRSTLITLAIIVVLIGLAATLLPRGFSDDIARIGQGGNVVVLVHNKESVLSLELMTMLNRVRPDYEDRVEFLAVDTATDRGRMFVAAQGVDDSLLVLFGPDGTRLAVLTGIRDEARLRAALEGHFDLRG